MSGASRTSRDRIFAAMAANRAPAAEARPAYVPPPMPADPAAILEARLRSNGGGFVRASATAWCDDVEWPDALDALPHVFVGRGVDTIGGRDARCPASRGVGASATSGRALAALDLTVLRASFAVVENGAAWVEPADAIERSAALLAEHLVVLVDARDLVATLHEAYERIARSDTRFGWFLAGPSKTADIEQAMVLGAHGACSMQLVLIDD